MKEKKNTIHLTETKIIITADYEKVYANPLEKNCSLYKMDKFLERHKL